MTETVQCATHGEQERTFVCQHLFATRESGQSVGFFKSRRPRGDAWCAQCEAVRVREGGATGAWNDVSEAFAGIKVICGAFYDRIRAAHQP